MCIGLHVKYLLFLHILLKLEHSRKLSKRTQILDFMKIHSVGAKLFQSDRWTLDRRDEASKRFLQFCDCA
jgi:hypothetical protein